MTNINSNSFANALRNNMQENTQHMPQPIIKETNENIEHLISIAVNKAVRAEMNEIHDKIKKTVREMITQEMSSHITVLNEIHKRQENTYINIMTEINNLKEELKKERKARKTKCKKSPQKKKQEGAIIRKCKKKGGKEYDTVGIDNILLNLASSEEDNLEWDNHCLETTTNIIPSETSPNSSENMPKIITSTENTSENKQTRIYIPPRYIPINPQPGQRTNLRENIKTMGYWRDIRKMPEKEDDSDEVFANTKEFEELKQEVEKIRKEQEKRLDIQETTEKISEKELGELKQAAENLAKEQKRRERREVFRKDCVKFTVGRLEEELRRGKRWTEKNTKEYEYYLANPDYFSSRYSTQERRQEYIDWFERTKEEVKLFEEVSLEILRNKERQIENKNYSCISEATAEHIREIEEAFEYK